MVEFQKKDRYGYEDLVQIVHLLRSPGVCPWDQEQTHQSIARNFLEETYEVLEAIDQDDPVHLCEELGDVLTQVVFHGDMEQDAGRFTLEDVYDGICKKLILRHPHVFGSTVVGSTGEVLNNWDAIKRVEKDQKTFTDTLEAVPKNLPANWRAEKLMKRLPRRALPGTMGSRPSISWRRKPSSWGRPWWTGPMWPRSWVTPSLPPWVSATRWVWTRRRYSMQPVRNSPAGLPPWSSGPAAHRWIRFPRSSFCPCGTTVNPDHTISTPKKEVKHVMNKTELIAAVAEKAGIAKKDAEKAVNATLDAITETMVAGDKVQLVGFGTFETRRREARTGRNPRTKEAFEIPASTVPAFKPGKALKDQVNK